MVHGRALDRSGNVIPGVKVTLLDVDHKVVGNTVTDARGEFAFNQVPMAKSQDIFMIRATFDADGCCWSSDTSYFNVMAMLITGQDVRFNDYPATGIGGLYGIVTSDNYLIIEEPATIYLDNGMFFLYPGNRYDQWYFDNLPQGKYVLWAERNVDNVTYASQRYNVTVRTDDKAYQPIYLPIKNPVAYHQQPVPLKNVVHGTIFQKNGELLPDARVDLYRCQGSALELVATTWSNINGQYLFNNVDVTVPSMKFMVRTTFEADGAQRSQDSGQFTVYYSNTINVNHDYDVSIVIPYATTGKATIISVPAGAQINIDGKDTGHITPYNFSLKSGTHLLGLSMDGYFCDNTTLQLQSDTDMTITRALKLSTGNLSLDVSPASARIFFNGNDSGIGQLTLTKSPAGVYTYVIVCDGYTNESGSVRILPGESITQQINMVASPGISLTYIGYLISSIFESIGRIF